MTSRLYKVNKPKYTFNTPSRSGLEQSCYIASWKQKKQQRRLDTAKRWTGYFQQGAFPLIQICIPYPHDNKKGISFCSRTCRIIYTFSNTLYTWKYSRVSFCDVSFYDDSLLRHLSIWTENVWRVLTHCSNSSVISLFSALLALFLCACVSSFSIFCSSLKLIVTSLSMTSIKKNRKRKKSKQLTLHSFLMSSEPRPGPSSAKLKVIWLIFFPIICVIFCIPNPLN